MLNSVLVSKRNFFQKQKQILLTPYLWTVVYDNYIVLH